MPRQKIREVELRIRFRTNVPMDDLIDRKELRRLFWEEFKDGQFKFEILDVEASEPVQAS